jgi:PPK2 family polyphosphate:nucleotide phosphotransferase
MPPRGGSSSCRRSTNALCDSGGINKQLRFAYDLVEPLRVAPGSSVRLRRDFDPGYTDGLHSKAEAAARLSEGVVLLADYQDRLAAQDTFGVLFILQGLDGAGKDSTIKHVMSGLNPKGVDVHNFKQPSTEELDHDVLWRYERALPERGRIGVFNRSHYEEVLVVRVHPELLGTERLPKGARLGDVWKRRYREINEWERYLVDNGIHVVKIFLNLSKREQARRFLKRIEDPEKNWKFSPSDVREREHWDAYQKAFNAMLSNTSTERAPWHVVPADHKWFSRLAAAAILVRTLAEIKPRYPRVSNTTLQEMAAARPALLAEAAGAGAPRRPADQVAADVARAC